MPNVDRMRASLAWFAKLLNGQSLREGEPRDDKEVLPSIYALIKTQIDANPSLVELDDAPFPAIVGTTGRIKFAPGLMDARFATDSAEGKGWQGIKHVIDTINAGEITEWQAVEERVAAIRTSPNIDKLLSGLTIADVSDPVEDLFMQVALNSRNYEAVKWGIEIGGIRLSKPFADQLLVLARHPEFTPFVSFVLLRASDRHPEYKQYLVQLLPVSYQWGVITLIGYLVRDPSLIAQTAIQRDILIYGMEHNGGIPMEVGLTIARAIDIDHFFHEALENTRTRAAILSLMNTLLSEPHPLGGILDLENAKGIFEGYLVFLAKTFTDILTLYAFRHVEHFLSDDQPPWADRVDKLHVVQAQFQERFDINMVRSSLHDAKSRWIGLAIARELNLLELKQDILALFERDPKDYLAVWTLCEIGDGYDVKGMLRRISDLIDLDARAKRPIRHTNVIGEEEQDGDVYARIISSLWKNADREAAESLKTALRDYDPAVRSAACHAVSKLPLELVDSEIKELVIERLTDSPEYVQQEAKEAATAIGVQT